MRAALAVTLLVGLSLPLPAFGRSERQDLLDAWGSANLFCRGSSGAVSDTACAFRDQLDKVLDKLGWCYGKEGQAGYQMTWHRCGKGSLRE